MRLTRLRFRREFASGWLNFQNESTGSINAQVIATDPAGNRSDPAWFNFTVI